jgi:hypothetical protein
MRWYAITEIQREKFIYQGRSVNPVLKGYCTTRN